MANIKQPSVNASIDLGSFSKKYDNIYAVAMHVGANNSNPAIVFNSANPDKPSFRYNVTTSKWQITDDGVNYLDLSPFQIITDAGNNNHTVFNITTSNNAIIQVDLNGVPSKPAIKFDNTNNKWYFKTTDATWYELPLLNDDNLAALNKFTVDGTSGEPLWNGNRWPYPIKVDTLDSSVTETWPASKIVDVIKDKIDARINVAVPETSTDATWPALLISTTINDKIDARINSSVLETSTNATWPASLISTTIDSRIDNRISSSVSKASTDATWPAATIDSMISTLISSTDITDTDKTFSAKEASETFYLKKVLENIKSNGFIIYPENNGSNYYTITADTGASDKPVIRFNSDSGKWEFTNDGATWTEFGKVDTNFNLDDRYYRKNGATGDKTQETFSQEDLDPSDIPDTSNPGSYLSNPTPGVLDNRYYVKSSLLPNPLNPTDGSGALDGRYYTQTALDAKLTSNYYTSLEVDTNIQAVDDKFSQYAKTTDITSNYYKKSVVDNKLRGFVANGNEFTFGIASETDLVFNFIEDPSGTPGEIPGFKYDVNDREWKLSSDGSNWSAISTKDNIKLINLKDISFSKADALSSANYGKAIIVKDTSGGTEPAFELSSTALVQKLNDLTDVNVSLADIADSNNDDHPLVVNNGKVVVRSSKIPSKFVDLVEASSIVSTDIATTNGNKAIVVSDTVDGKFELSASPLVTKFKDLSDVNSSIDLSDVSASGKFIVVNDSGKLDLSSKTIVDSITQLSDVAIVDDDLKIYTTPGDPTSEVIPNVGHPLIINSAGKIAVSAGSIKEHLTDYTDQVAFTATDLTNASDDTYAVGVNNNKLSLIGLVDEFTDLKDVSASKANLSDSNSVGKYLVVKSVTDGTNTVNKIGLSDSVVPTIPTSITFFDDVDILSTDLNTSEGHTLVVNSAGNFTLSTSTFKDKLTDYTDQVGFTAAQLAAEQGTNSKIIGVDHGKLSLVSIANYTGAKKLDDLEDVDLGRDITNADNGKLLYVQNSKVTLSNIALPERVTDFTSEVAFTPANLLAANDNEYVVSVVDHKLALVRKVDEVGARTFSDLTDATTSDSTISDVSNAGKYLVIKSVDDGQGGTVGKIGLSDSVVPTIPTSITFFDDVALTSADLSDSANADKFLKIDSNGRISYSDAVVKDQLTDYTGEIAFTKSDLDAVNSNTQYVVGVVDHKLAFVNRIHALTDLNDIDINATDIAISTNTGKYLQVAPVSDGNGGTVNKVVLSDRAFNTKFTELTDVNITDTDLVSGGTVPNEGSAVIVNAQGKLSLTNFALSNNLTSMSDVNITEDLTDSNNDGKYIVVDSTNGEFKLSNSPNKLSSLYDVNIDPTVVTNSANLNKPVVVGPNDHYVVSDYAFTNNFVDLNEVDINDLSTNLNKGIMTNSTTGHLIAVDMLTKEELYPAALVGDEKNLSETAALDLLYVRQGQLFPSDPNDPIELDDRYYTKSVIDTKLTYLNGLEVKNGYQLILGKDDSSITDLMFSAKYETAATYPTIKFNVTAGKWQISNNGTDYVDLKVIDDSKSVTDARNDIANLTSNPNNTDQVTWSLKKLANNIQDLIIDDSLTLASTDASKRTYSIDKILTGLPTWVISDTTSTTGADAKKVTWSVDKLIGEFANKAGIVSSLSSTSTTDTFSASQINSKLEGYLIKVSDPDFNSYINNRTASLANTAGPTISQIRNFLDSYALIDNAGHDTTWNNSEYAAWSIDVTQSKLNAMITASYNSTLSTTTSAWSVDAANDAYLNKNGDMSTTGYQKFLLGTADSANIWQLIANVSSTNANPFISYNSTDGKWYFSNDGTTLVEFGSVDPNLHNHDLLYYRKSELIDDANPTGSTAKALDGRYYVKTDLINDLAPTDTSSAKALDGRYYVKTELIDSSAPTDTSSAKALDGRYYVKSELIDSTTPTDLTNAKALDGRYYVKTELVDPSDPTGNSGSKPLDARYYDKVALLPGGAADPLAEDTNGDLIPAALDGRYVNKNEAEENFIKTYFMETDPSTGEVKPQVITGSLKVTGDIIAGDSFTAENALYLRHLAPATISAPSVVVETDATGKIDPSFIPNFNTPSISIYDAYGSKITFSPAVTLTAGNNVKILPTATSDEIEISSHVDPWYPNVHYREGQLVTQGNRVYQCVSEHTSNTKWSADLEIGNERWKVIGIFNAIANHQVESDTINAFFVTASSSDPYVINKTLDNPSDYKKTDVEIYKFVPDNEGYQWDYDYVPNKFDADNLSTLSNTKYLTVTKNNELTIDTDITFSMSAYGTAATEGRTLIMDALALDEFHILNSFEMVID